VGLFTSK
jgi:hypothetical protein